MEQIIEKIVDIDNKAQQMLKEAEDDKKNLDKTIQDEIDKIQRELNERASKKCMTIRSVEDNEADTKIEKIEAGKKEAIRKLEDIYNKNKDKWVLDIVSEIINS